MKKFRPLLCAIAVRRCLAQVTALAPWKTYASWPRRAVLSQPGMTVGMVGITWLGVLAGKAAS